MKTPLNYQITGFDCGPTTIVNALKALYEREELPPVVIQKIYMLSLDGFNANGEAGKTGTSADAIVYISHWINQYSDAYKWSLHAKAFMKDEVNYDMDSEIMTAIRKGSVAIARCILHGGHYVLIRKYENGNFYIFDPFYSNEDMVEPYKCEMKTETQEYNRIVTYEWFTTGERNVYQIDCAEKRELMLFTREN